MTRADRRRAQRQAGYRGKKSKRGATKAEAKYEVMVRTRERRTQQSKANVRSMGVWVP